MTIAQRFNFPKIPLWTVKVTHATMLIWQVRKGTSTKTWHISCSSGRRFSPPLSDFCDLALDALGYSAGRESRNRAVEWTIFREPDSQRGGSMQEQGLEYLFLLVKMHMDIF